MNSILTDLTVFGDKIHTLAVLKRYNNTAHIKDESVAEHLAFTALFVMQLCEHYMFDTHTALEMALTHDLPEIYTSDVPHPVKVAFPEICAPLRKAENYAMEQFNHYWRDLNNAMEDCETLTAHIVNLADVLSVIQYTKAEIALGNIGMEKIRVGAVERATVLMTKIQTRFPYACRAI